MCSPLKYLFISSIIAIAGILLFITAVYYIDETNTANNGRQRGRLITSPKNIYEQHKKAIVKLYSINKEKDKRRLLNGTGFIAEVGGPKIVTNRHIVANQGNIIAISHNNAWTIKSWVEHPTLDIALLNIEDIENGEDVISEILELDTDSAINPGEKIYTLGYPLGLSLAIQQGIINATDGTKLIFSAPLSEGSSGSPLMNESGKVIGICDSFFLNAQNYNLATPSSLAFLSTQWLPKTAEDNPEIKEYIDEVAKTKITSQKKIEYWEEIIRNSPQWERWVKKTNLTRIPTQNAIEQAYLSFWFVQWGMIANEKNTHDNEKSAEILLTQSDLLKKAWQLHKENLLASEDIKPNENLGVDNINNIEDLVNSFDAISQQLTKFLSLEDKKRRSNNLQQIIEGLQEFRQQQAVYKKSVMP